MTLRQETAPRRQPNLYRVFGEFKSCSWNGCSHLGLLDFLYHLVYIREGKWYLKNLHTMRNVFQRNFIFHAYISNFRRKHSRKFSVVQVLLPYKESEERICAEIKIAFVKHTALSKAFLLNFFGTTGFEAN